MKFIDLINRVDNSPPSYIGWTFHSHDGILLGKLIESVIPHLEPVAWLEVQQSTKSVRINDPHNLDEKFARLTSQWRESETFECLKGWRDEVYTCFTTNQTKYFDIERSAAAIFGIVTYGCHITGFCPSTKKIWVPRRAQTKQTYPGMLDNTVAGGLGNGVGFRECAIKECGEEAGLDPQYLETRLLPVGAVTYEFQDPETGYFQPEVECVYDLNMESESEPVTPKPTDGEVQEFYLLSYAEVKQKMLAGEFKYNCALVLIDFFIRHGEITAEEEANYVELASRCHRTLEYPLRGISN